MREEDKKIIEHLKYWVEFHIKYNTPVSPYSISCVGKALNLIEKQQKQIDNSIPKDIIKKIHENTDTRRKFTDEILKLLEE